MERPRLSLRPISITRSAPPRRRSQSTSGRLIRFPLTTGCFPSAGMVPIPSRRSVDAAYIPCFKVEKITALIAAAGTVLRFISRPAPLVEKAGAKPGHVPNKGEGK